MTRTITDTADRLRACDMLTLDTDLRAQTSVRLPNVVLVEGITACPTHGGCIAVAVANPHGSLGNQPDATLHIAPGYILTWTGDYSLVGCAGHRPGGVDLDRSAAEAVTEQAMADTASYLDLRVMDLFERAMCLGYDEGAAAQLADCFEDYGYGSVDACPKHPNHSTVRDHNGYAVDMCAACHVIILSDGEGYYPGKWADVQATREAEYVAIMERQIAESYEAGQCACDLIMEMGGQRLPEGGRVCLVCGSLFTATGTEASPEVLAESERVVKGETSLSFHTTQDSEFIDTLKDLLTLEPVKGSVRHEVGPTGKTYCGRTLATNGTGRACKSCPKVKRVETGQTYADVRAAREAEVIKAAEAVKVPSNVCRSTNHVYCVGPCPQRDRNEANASATRTHVETESECAARIAREDFRVGDVVTFRTTTGYKLSQNRPYDCCYACRCGMCDGVTTVTEQRLTEVIHWVSGGLDIRGAQGGYRMVRPDRLD